VERSISKCVDVYSGRLPAWARFFFVKALGNDNVVKLPPVMMSEDFGYLSLDQKIPATLFTLGAVDPVKVKQSKEAGTQLPSLHSALFQPLPEPTLRTGIKAMASAVLELMKK